MRIRDWGDPHESLEHQYLNSIDSMGRAISGMSFVCIDLVRISIVHRPENSAGGRGDFVT